MRIFKKKKNNSIKLADPCKNQAYYDAKYQVDDSGLELCDFLNSTHANLKIAKKSYVKSVPI